MKVREHNIKSLTDYIEICQRLPNQLFRGESDSSRQLLPSLFRHNIRHDKQFYKWQGIEMDILESFKRSGSRYLLDTENDILEIIAQTRHFGLPSRLLDWSSNPLVALYFSVIDKYSEHNLSDGVVWFLTGQGWITDKFNTLKNLRSWFKNRHSYGILVYNPKKNNDRIIAQSGCFTIHKVPWTNTDVKSIYDTGFSPHAGQFLEKIIIPGELKYSLRVELDRLGINHFSLFPHGDGLAKDLEWRAFFNAKGRSYTLENLERSDV